MTGQSVANGDKKKTGVYGFFSDIIHKSFPYSHFASCMTGLKIISVPTRRINASALPPAIKSLNYLNNILAKI